MRVVVVGAGIAGASAAFHLTRFGADVCLVESNGPGRATLAGAGIICPWLSQNEDPRYQTLAFAAVRYYPELVARLAGEIFRVGLLTAARRAGLMEWSGTAVLRRSGDAVVGVRVGEESLDA